MTRSAGARPIATSINRATDACQGVKADGELALRDRAAFRVAISGSSQAERDRPSASKVAAGVNGR
jgi:hypothetical protein